MWGDGVFYLKTYCKNTPKSILEAIPALVSLLKISIYKSRVFRM